MTFVNGPGIKAAKLDEQGCAAGGAPVQVNRTDATVALPADGLDTIFRRSDNDYELI